MKPAGLAGCRELDRAARGHWERKLRVGALAQGAGLCFRKIALEQDRW